MFIFRGGNASEIHEDAAPHALASSSHRPEVSHGVEIAVVGDGGSEEEDVWTEDAVDASHCLTHLPKSRKCPICLQAKLYEAPHRRRANERAHLRDIRDIEEPTAPLERIACDHVISRTSIGIGGETCSLVVVDRFSKLVGVMPCKSKHTDEVEAVLRRFCGHRSGIVSVASDRAPEILSAIKRLGFTDDPAEPRSKLHNPYAESFIRTLTGMTAAILLQAGLSHDYWPLAHKYIEWAYPITTFWDGGEGGPLTFYEWHHGYAYEGYKVPFGALVWIKDFNPRPFDPKGEPALFLGGELTDGMKFKGLYRAWPVDQFKEGVLRERVVRALAIPPATWALAVPSKN